MDTFRGADKKLGELMLKGWTMLSESCDTCNCPLMRNPDGQKYCVNCEVWVYDNKKKEQKKFSELFPSRINQMKQEKKEIIQKNEKKGAQEKKEKELKKESQKKEKEEKIEKKPQNIPKSITNGSFIDLLNNKLILLAQNLNEETDVKKCEEIIELMNKVIGLIEHYKKII